MSKKAKLSACLAGLVAPWLLATTGMAGSDEQYAPTSVITLPNNQLLTSFDISFVDPALHVYALADRTNKSVDVINTRNNSVSRELTGCGGNVANPSCSVFVGVQPGGNAASGPNGVIIIRRGERDKWQDDHDNKHVEVWAPDGVVSGGTSKVHVINFRTNALIASIDTGGKQRADELCHDPQRAVVLVANDDPVDSFLTFISSISHTIIGKIKLDGTDPNGNNITANGIEQCQWNSENGKFYLSVPDIGGGAGAVLVISTRAPFHVERVFPVAAATGCTGPQGLAFGPHHEIQLGCGGANSVIIDSRNGAVVATETGQGNADEVWYDPGSNHFFIAESNNANLGVEDAGPPPKADPNAPSAIGSHSVAVDPFRNQVYVPIRSNTVAGTNATVCGAKGGSNNNGCIAVYTAPNDRDDCLDEHSPVRGMKDGWPVFHRERCEHHDLEARR
jgi:hypothetical protein